MTRSIACFLALIWLACASRGAAAQDLTPRAYGITPVGYTAVVVDYSRLSGGLEFDGAVPITGAEANVNLGVLGFYHAFSLLGHSANFAVNVPYGTGDFHGTVVDVPRQEDRSGLLATAFRVSMNLLGGPALAPQQFSAWRQDVLIGVSLTVTTPTGQYDSERLINFGNNRWGAKPEIGYSQRFGDWLVDAYAGVWFFSKNTAFFPGASTQSQAPEPAVESHLSYDVAPRLWVSLDANYWWGGATTVNGLENPATNQKNSRVGATASVPLTAHQSLKFSYSQGAYISYGGNYRSYSLAWQYGWMGGHH